MREPVDVAHLPITLEDIAGLARTAGAVFPWVRIGALGGSVPLAFTAAGAPGVPVECPATPEAEEEPWVAHVVTADMVRVALVSLEHHDTYAPTWAVWRQLARRGVGSADATTADLIIQIALYGQPVYGVIERF